MLALNTQITLWMILPVTLAFLALSFTGVYAHQKTMRDFVISRGLALARLTARATEDALGHGIIDLGGERLSAWLPLLVGDHPGVIMVVDRSGLVLAHPNPELIGNSLGTATSSAIFAQDEGFVSISDTTEIIADPSLIMFASVTAADWAVLVQEPVEGLSSSILRFASLAPIVATVAGTLSILILGASWYTIIRPLQELDHATNQVSENNLDPLTQNVGGVQEIQDLQQAIQDMIDRIRSYQAAIRDYANNMAQSQEAERTRLARELHDGPVQDVIALAQRTEMAQHLVEQGANQRASQMLQDVRSAEQTLVINLRNLISHLRPLYLEDLGLLPAIEALVEQSRPQTSAQITLKQLGQPWPTTSDANVSIYRIVQEALQNAIRHAQARYITVRVHYYAAELALAIIDDGVGFKVPPKPDALTRQGHFGLVGIQERAALFQGTSALDSTPSQGTRITLSLPRHAIT